MSAFSALLGEELLTKAGTVSTAEALAGKVVALYFSAHWCPPCRGFTPQLAGWYTSDLQAKGLEVVFVSSDKDEGAFTDYYGEQPWTSLPYSDRSRKETLSKKFKVQGIPSLVLLDQDAKVITLDGRSAISKDPTGENYPWKPKPFHEVLGTSFVGQDGAVLDAAAVQDKVLGIYFSAHWCPPCKTFTPQLAAWYKNMKTKGIPFEIVFASSDKTEEAFNEYFAEMPWIALPYADRKGKEALSDMFGVEGIPSFVIVDKDGKTITTSGRGIPASDPEGADFPWHPKPVKDIASDAEGLNSSACVVALVEGMTPAEQAAIEAALTPLAKELADKAKLEDEDPEMLFYIAKSGGGPVGQIRKLCKLPALITPHEHPLAAQEKAAHWNCDGGCGRAGADERFRCTEGCDFDYCGECNAKAQAEQPAPAAKLILLDIPDKGGFYLPEMAEITDASVRAMVAQYKAKSLARLQLG